MKLNVAVFVTALVAFVIPAAGQAASPARTSAKASPATASPNWTSVIGESPSGGFVMGNPKAKVRLVEIASLSCPHCRKFEQEGAPALVSKYVKSGKVSWEFRPYLIHGAIDMAANLTVRCNGSRSFFPLTNALYKDQATWLARIEATPESRTEALRSLPKERMFVEIGNILGLQTWAATRGVPRAKSNACLSNSKMIDQEISISNAVGERYPEFRGTPAFVINGKMLPKDVTTWARLEPYLKEAMK
jgi:protein-disulfide isomerase